MIDLPFKKFSEGNEERIKINDNNKKIIIIAGAGVLAIILIVVILSLTGAFRKISGKYIFSQTDSSNVLDMQQFGNECVILTRTKTVYCSSDGNQKTGSDFTYANPVMKCNGKKVLIYDRGGTGYKLERFEREWFSGTASGAIVTAAVGKNGSVAYSVDAESDSFSQSSVYFRKNEKSEAVCVLRSSDEYCVALAISDDENELACVFTGVENAEKYFRIVKVAVESKKLTTRETNPFYGIDLYGIDYSPEGNLKLVSSEGIYVLLKSELTAELRYPMDATDILYNSICPDGISIVIRAKNSNKYQPEVVIFSKSGVQTGVFSCDKEINSFAVSEKYVAVTCKKSVYVYDSTGLLCGRATLTDDDVKITVAGRYVFVLQPTGIYIAPIRLTDDDDIPILGNSKDDEMTTELIIEQETGETEIVNIDGVNTGNSTDESEAVTETTASETTTVEIADETDENSDTTEEETTVEITETETQEESTADESD